MNQCAVYGRFDFHSCQLASCLKSHYQNSSRQGKRERFYGSQASQANRMDSLHFII
jgi:hypothetical protein